jgi:hypothetical protein
LAHVIGSAAVPPRIAIKSSLDPGIAVMGSTERGFTGSAACTTRRAFDQTIPGA